MKQNQNPESEYLHKAYYCTWIGKQYCLLSPAFAWDMTTVLKNQFVYDYHKDFVLQLSTSFTLHKYFWLSFTMIRLRNEKCGQLCLFEESSVLLSKVHEVHIWSKSYGKQIIV